jgi:hypothetical protein
MALIKIKSESMDLADDYTFTGTVEGAGGGITEADTWRLNTNFINGNTSFNDLTANLERDDSTGSGYLGTGMTQSSGVFTFPSTGIWLIRQTWYVYDDADFAWFEGFTRTTINNSSYDTRVQSGANVNGRTAGSPETTATGECFFDVTDTSTHKVSFHHQASDPNVNILGNTNYNATHFTFIRLGDT